MTSDVGMETAVVMGAGRPFGFEIVSDLVRKGFRVTAVDAVLPRVEYGAIGVEVAKVDMADHRALAILFAAHAKIDVVVTNTPVTLGNKRFLDVTDADFNDALEYSVVQPTLIVQAALDYLNPDARIVQVASRAHLGGWFGTHHMAAGGAAVTMSRSIAWEFSSLGIRHNIVAPDFVDEIGDNPDIYRQIASTVGFLASRESALINGETILVNSGRSIQLPEQAKK